MRRWTHGERAGYRGGCIERALSIFKLDHGGHMERERWMMDARKHYTFHGCASAGWWTHGESWILRWMHRVSAVNVKAGSWWAHGERALWMVDARKHTSQSPLHEYTYIFSSSICDRGRAGRAGVEWLCLENRFSYRLPCSP